jgi:hypothetical protein
MSRLTNGDAMPAFSIGCYGAGVAKLASADLKGKVAVVNSWGAWCGPCVAGIDHSQPAHPGLHAA